MAYSCCFSLSKNLDFLDFLKKRFITSTIGGGLVISEHALYVDYLSLNPADTKSYFCIVAKLRNKIKKINATFLIQIYSDTTSAFTIQIFDT